MGPNSLAGPVDPATDSGWQPEPRMGFFTDTTVCIGCKACEVACKEWNLVPEDGLDLTGMSYDNTGALGASTWRHVAFIEQEAPPRRGGGATDLGMPALREQRTGGEDAQPQLAVDDQQAAGPVDVRWLMSSDVCKHCTHAGCLDVCPTGALFRTDTGTVVVQQDICNGCGYCVPACPFGVIDQRKDDGRAFKCTLCHDRTEEGLMPACATACPTQSIQYGPLDQLRETAAARVEALHAGGVEEARLYLESDDDGIGGAGAFFLLLDEPEVYGLPPDPVVPTRDLGQMWRRAGMAAVGMVATAVVAFAGRRR
ncbi:4Fe-4S dicluster domain-containing protein [Angustibacter aerolatus]